MSRWDKRPGAGKDNSSSRSDEAKEERDKNFADPERNIGTDAYARKNKLPPYDKD